jgi:hypothetical protein
MLRSRRLVLLLTILITATACIREAATTTTTALTTTSEHAPTTTNGPATTTTTIPQTTSTTEPQGDTVTVLLYPLGEMGEGWTDLVFPYGTSEDTLGTAPGGEGLTLGPEYGTQLSDGSWWFMDAAKLRLAHFDNEGDYLGQVEVPENVLVDGQYFQFQFPIGLDDGTVLASGFRGEASTALMFMRDEVITEETIDETVPWVTTDGALLYGFSAADDAPAALDPSSVTPSDVEWFQARDGSRYMVTVGDSEVVVDMPDAGVTKTLQLRFSEDPEIAASAGIEVETGIDGSLFILIYGAPVSGDIFDIGSLVRISPDGHVGEAEPIAQIFTPADPGSPSHLGVTPGTSNPWMMVIGEDGVHVYSSG